MSYFKPEDVGEGLEFTFLGGSMKEKKKKDGGTYSVYEMMVQFDDGTTDTKDAFPNVLKYANIYNPDTGETAKAGTRVQVYMNGDYVNYKIVGKSESVTPQATAPVKASNACVDNITRLVAACIIKSYDDPLEAALAMYKQIEEESKKM